MTYRSLLDAKLAWFSEVMADKVCTTYLIAATRLGQVFSGKLVRFEGSGVSESEISTATGFSRALWLGFLCEVVSGCC